MFSAGLEASFKDWEGTLFLIWNRVQLHRRAKWSGVRRGKLGLCQTYLKSEKEGRWRGSHPAGCFTCHSEESQAKFSPSRKQKILELYLTPQLPEQMQCSSCVLLISWPVFVNMGRGVLQRQTQRDVQKRPVLCGLHAVGQGVKPEY